jgi:hypothetical protein
MMLYAKEFQMMLSCNHRSDSNFYLISNFLLKISVATRGVSPSRLRIRAAMGRACYAIQIKPIFEKRSRLFGCSIPLDDVCLLNDVMVLEISSHFLHPKYFPPQRVIWSFRICGSSLTRTPPRPDPRPGPSDDARASREMRGDALRRRLLR